MTSSNRVAWAVCLVALAVVTRVEPSLGNRAQQPAFADIRWPGGTVSVPCEDIDGVLLVRATVSGGPDRPQPDTARGMRAAPSVKDTTGWFAVDTGAGFLALDSQLALELGVLDSVSDHPIDVAPHPVQRFRIGDLTIDQVTPVVVFPGQLLSRVTDRPVLGLIGHRLMKDRALWIDYRDHRIALVPSEPSAQLDDASAVGASRRLLGSALSSAATPIRFRMLEDGKVLLSVRVTPIHGGGPTPWLNLALDTGASKCTLFEDVVAPLVSTSGWKPEIHGLAAPTLLETSAARLCRVKRIEVRGATGIAQAGQIELALIRNPLAEELKTLAGEPVHGLLGYSFLERFRVACDYPHRVLWLDPTPDINDSAQEPAQIGLQFDRGPQGVRIVAVVSGSPAAHAGIQPGDELISVDGEPVSGFGSTELGRKLEGAPGSAVVVVTRRGTLEQTHRLQRRRLL